MKSFYRFNLLVLINVLFMHTSFAEQQSSYFDMTLEELMEIEVTISSKTEEKSFNAASAIYVLSNEDIRRSGATTIAEALKLVPGVYVSEFSSIVKVSIRGFHYEITDKLLVLMDGRTLYTPLFSGVNWDEVDTYFNDIDRIEVVRGPGATLWGSNAVNGVINIVTKNAKDTVGTEGYVLAGNYDNFETAARSGFDLGDDSYFRGYVKYFDRGNTNNLDTDTDFFDDYESTRAGFRYDKDISKNESFKIQGDTYQNRLDLPYIDTITLANDNETDETSGGNILTKWQKKHYDGTSSIQAYIDYTSRDQRRLGDEKFTYDIELQRQQKYGKHDIVTGVGYRFVSDDLDNTAEITGNPERRDTDLVNFFIQDKYAIHEDKLYLTLGSKISHNDYTHSEWQPSGRISILPNEDNIFWSSISKAVRTPNRKENDPEAFFGFAAAPNMQIESEELIAYEFGYRNKTFKNFSLEFTAFYNDYSDLSAQSFDEEFNVIFDNVGDGYTYGHETTLNWQARDNWKLTANYSYIDMNLKDENGDNLEIDSNSIEDLTPDNIFSLRSYFNFNKYLEWDNIYYYYSTISNGSEKIKHYNGFTSRLSYKLNKKQNLSLVVKDIFDSTHTEEYSLSTVNGVPEIERRYYVKFSQKF